MIKEGTYIKSDRPKSSIPPGRRGTTWRGGGPRDPTKHKFVIKVLMVVAFIVCFLFIMKDLIAQTSNTYGSAQFYR